MKKNKLIMKKIMRKFLLFIIKREHKSMIALKKNNKEGVIEKLINISLDKCKIIKRGLKRNSLVEINLFAVRRKEEYKKILLETNKDMIKELISSLMKKEEATFNLVARYIG